MTPSAIIEFLTANKDRDFTAEMVASRFAVTGTAARAMLNEMAGMGVIRRSSAERSPRYYVASAARLAAEERASMVPNFRPLKIDRARTELYERLATERDGVFRA